MASIGFPLGADRGVMLMLRLYLDDIGTHGRSPVVGVRALIAREEEWIRFDAAWKAVLASPCPGKPALSKWSTFDCRYSLGEFESYTRAERDVATLNFRRVITESD